MGGLPGGVSGGVHAAGVLDDVVVEGLSGERLRGVLAAKVVGGWNLHEVMSGSEGLFVLFSSAAGVLGAAGQANYAAGNAFLDGLAAFRRARGLSGVSVAWGLWEERSVMTGGLERSDLARMRRMGVLPMSTEDGLRLLDTAERSPRERGPGRPPRRPLPRGRRRRRPPHAARARPETRRTPAPQPDRRRLRHPGPGHGAAGVPARAVARRTPGHPARPGARPGDHRARAPGRRHDRAGPGVPGPRPRLSDRRRPAQPARRRHRTAAARDAGLRPPQTAPPSPGTFSAKSSERKPTRRSPRPPHPAGTATRHPGRPRPTTRSPSSAWPAATPEA